MGFNSVFKGLIQIQLHQLYNPTTVQVKVKVKITPEQATKAQKGSTGTDLNFFFYLGARWGWMINTTPWPLDTPRRRAGTHCARDWVGPSAGLDTCGISRPHRDSIPGPSSPTALSRPQSYDCTSLFSAGTVSAITETFCCHFRPKHESFLMLKLSSPAVVSGSILAGQKRPECEAHYWPLTRKK